MGKALVFLQSVQLQKDGIGQDDIILLTVSERLDAFGIFDENIGIQNKCFFHATSRDKGSPCHAGQHMTKACHTKMTRR
jgi:hypothetical protein